MNILVFGGTRFVGRAIVECALDHAHDVTLFNRGSARELFPSVRRIIGDRTTNDVEQLGSSEWDCVVDVSAYLPSEVRGALRVLLGRAQHYVYVSTVSVYDNPPPGADEGAALIEVDESVPDPDPRAYGGRKVICERLLREALGDRLTVLRPTVVIGPHDYTDRFSWWVRHVARGGRIEAPRRLEQPVQLIDASDLGAFAVRVVEERIEGTFNTAGPEQPLTLGGLIETIAGTLGSSVEVVPVDDLDRFPLTLAAGGSQDGLFAVSSRAALEAGMTLRPIAGSVRAVARWQEARSGAG